MSIHPHNFENLSYFAKLTRIRPAVMCEVLGLFFFFLNSQEYFLSLNVFVEVSLKSTKICTFFVNQEQAIKTCIS